MSKNKEWGEIHMKRAAHSFLLMYIAICVLLLNISWVAAAEEKTAPPAKPLYNDVTSDNPNYAFVTYLAKRGIVSGFSDGTYHPADSLTRAQAAVIMTKAAGLTYAAVNASSFKDVPASHWAINYITAAEKAGYLKGFGDGTFRPEQTLTRAQAVSLIMRLATQKERASLPVLTDMNNQHWAAADMATALALKMIETDSQKISPESPMNRGSLCRALAILLTQDPGLNQAVLLGKVTEVQGSINLTRGGKTEALRENMSIAQGDVIDSVKGSKARVSFPDGSSTLIEENSHLIINKAVGRNYIKQDGTPGVAIDFLNIDMKQGTVFGALATKQEDIGKEATKAQAGLSPLFASQNSLKQLAAAATDQSPAWYKTAEKKKVKVKIDMPWGVAAVRGTFYKTTVNEDGSCKVSCLTGNVDLAGKNGGTVPLGANQTSFINSSGNAPAPAAPMDQSEINAFNQEQVWVLETAVQIDMNREALVGIMASSAKVDVSVQNQKTALTTLQVIINALQASGIQITNEMKNSLRDQLNQIDKQLNNPYQGANIQSQLSASQGNTNTNSSSGSNSSSGGSGGSTPSTISSFTYDTAGTYGTQDETQPLTVSSITINAAGVTIRNMTVQGNVTVNQHGATLQNITIAGNLVLGAGIAEGDATLINVRITGDTVIAGGGGHSIHLVGRSLASVTVDKENNSIRIVAEGDTSIGTLTLKSGATLEESGVTGSGFSNIICSSEIPAKATIILSGSFNSLVVDGGNLDILLASGSVAAVEVNAANTSLNMVAGTSITTLTANASAIVTGAGQIATAVINAVGVTLEKVPLDWKIKDGLTVNIAGTTVTSDGPISNACDLSGVTTLPDPVITNNTITATVPSSQTTVTVSPTISQYATWKLYSDQACETEISNTIPCPSTAYIKVTAQDGEASQVYTLTVNTTAMNTGSHDCDVLAVANLSGTNIAANNTTGTITGQVTGANSIMVSPIVSPDATWKLYSDSNCQTEINDNPMSLPNPTNIAYLKVTAQDGTTSKVYTLTITRISNACDLSAVAGLTLTPSTHTVTGDVYGAVNVTINPTVSSNATWKLYSNSACTAEIANPIPTSQATNIDYIKVTAQDGTTSQVYTLVINRPDIAAANSACDVLALADLTNASITAGTITGDVIALTSFTVNPIISSGTAWQLYSDQGCTATIVDHIMPLPNAANTAYIKVTAADGTTTQVYTLTVNYISKACDVLAVASLSNSSIASGAITGDISGVSSITLSLTVSPNATWRLYSDSACSQEITNKTMSVANARNIVYVKVTAQDGNTSQVYTLMVKRLSDTCDVLAIANIMEQSIAGTTISGKVANSTATLEIVPNINGVSWKLFNADGVTENATNSLSLAVGNNTACIKVTAEAGNSKTYTLIIKRISNGASVVNKDGGNAYAITDGAPGSIAGNTVAITTNMTVNDFLSHLDKDTSASWKVVSSLDSTSINNAKSFSKVTARGDLATLRILDKLAVLAEDGKTVKIYDIDVQLGTPDYGAGEPPTAPKIDIHVHNGNGSITVTERNVQLKISYPSFGFVWGDYRYFVYSFADGRPWVAIVAFDSDNQVVDNWVHGIGASRWIDGLNPNDDGKVSIIINGNKYWNSWTEIKIFK